MMISGQTGNDGLMVTVHTDGGQTGNDGLMMTVNPHRRWTNRQMFND